MFNLAIFDLFDFVRNGLIAGVIIGIIAPIIGSVVIIRRLSFIADTLSHFSLAGIAIGVFLSHIINLPFISPTIVGIVFSLIGTFLIDHLRNFYKNYKELSMPIILSLGVALTGIFIRLSSGISASQMSSLFFGSIFAVKSGDLFLFVIIGIGVLTIAVTLYRPILTMCFDETFARVSGINTRFYSNLITIVLAIVISILTQVIGVLLVSALIILPVAASILIGKSFKNTIAYSILFSEFSILLGFTLSSEFDFLVTGPTIVLINFMILVFVMIVRNLKSKIINRLNNFKDIT
jgi:zinc transport system permease protein